MRNQPSPLPKTQLGNDCTLHAFRFVLPGHQGACRTLDNFAKIVLMNPFLPPTPPDFRSTTDIEIYRSKLNSRFYNLFHEPMRPLCGSLFVFALALTVF